MKNPFKGISDKVRSTWDRMKLTENKKAEMRKNMVDSFGDGCFVGGLTLLGAAFLAPVATGPTLIAASLFLAAGGTAKYTASKMKPNGPTLEKALPPAPPPAEPNAPGTPAKPVGPAFKQSVEAKAKETVVPPIQKMKPNPPVI
jgi:hypothetical protein